MTPQVSFSNVLTASTPELRKKKLNLRNIPEKKRIANLFIIGYFCTTLNTILGHKEKQKALKYAAPKQSSACTEPLG